MRRILLLASASVLMPALACAQSVTNSAPTFTPGTTIKASDAMAAFATKVDGVDGNASGLTSAGGYFNNATISAPTISGGTDSGTDVTQATVNGVTLGSIQTVANAALPLSGGSLTGSLSLPTITLTGSQLQSAVLAAPSGSAGSPTFRTLTAADISGVAPLASPALTGMPTVPTPATNDNSTRIASTAFVANAVSAVQAGSGGAPINNPTFTGTVTIPTIVISGSQAQSAVLAAPASAAGAPTFRTLAVGDIQGAAPLASPTLTGIPNAPTAVAGTNTTQLATTAFVTGSQATRSDVFSSSGTWTKLAAAQTVCWALAGAGGNGGPGTTIAAGASGSGGGGGGSGALVTGCAPATLIPSSVAVTIPAQEAPVASGSGIPHTETQFGSIAIAPAGGDGGPGNAGAAAYGGSSSSANVSAQPSTATAAGSVGRFGTAGTTGQGGSGNLPTPTIILGGAGGGSSATGSATSSGFALGMTSGGGAGGGMNAGVATNGASSAANGLTAGSGGAAGGGNGGPGNGTWPLGLPCTGGGGGGGNASGVGGAGANSICYAAAGGGGGSGVSGGGLGGQGGPAVAIIWQY